MINRHLLAVVVTFLCGVILLAGCSSGKSESVVNDAAIQEAGSGQTPPPSQGWEASLDVGGAKALAADYQQQCGTQATASEECEMLRSLLVAEVVVAFQMMERARDQRATEEALAALDIVDEPEIVIAACRILGKFPDTPGIAAKVLPLLDSRYVEVQRMAARVLSALPDDGLAAVGGAWSENHSSLSESHAYEEYPDFPAHYAGLGFPSYPGATWFSPADSDRSIGWSTNDDVATVVRWFGQALRAEPQAAEQWSQTQSEQMAVGFQAFDPAETERRQQLMEKAYRGDESAMAEVVKLQEEMEAESKRADAAMESQAINVANPPGLFAPDARWIVADKKNGRISRMVLVYPVASLRRTVIQVIWDLAEYPSAWPKAAE